MIIETGKSLVSIDSIIDMKFNDYMDKQTIKYVINNKRTFLRKAQQTILRKTGRNDLQRAEDFVESFITDYLRTKEDYNPSYYRDDGTKVELDQYVKKLFSELLKREVSAYHDELKKVQDNIIESEDDEELSIFDKIHDSRSDIAQYTESIEDFEEDYRNVFFNRYSDGTNDTLTFFLTMSLLNKVKDKTELSDYEGLKDAVAMIVDCSGISRFDIKDFRKAVHLWSTYKELDENILMEIMDRYTLASKDLFNIVNVIDTIRKDKVEEKGCWYSDKIPISEGNITTYNKDYTNLFKNIYYYHAEVKIEINNLDEFESDLMENVRMTKEQATELEKMIDAAEKDKNNKISLGVYIIKDKSDAKGGYDLQVNLVDDATNKPVTPLNLGVFDNIGKYVKNSVMIDFEEVRDLLSMYYIALDLGYDLKELDDKMYENNIHLGLTNDAEKLKIIFEELRNKGEAYEEACKLRIGTSTLGSTEYKSSVMHRYTDFEVVKAKKYKELIDYDMRKIIENTADLILRDYPRTRIFSIGETKLGLIDKSKDIQYGDEKVTALMRLFDRKFKVKLGIERNE